MEGSNVCAATASHVRCCSRRLSDEVPIPPKSSPPDRLESEKATVNRQTCGRASTAPRCRYFSCRTRFLVLFPDLLSIFRSRPSNIMGDTDSVTFTKVPLIPCEKLIRTINYNIWAGAVKMWFHGQGYENHLTTKVDSIPAAKRDKWKQTDASLCIVLWFSIATNLQAQYQAFTTCYEVWEKAKKVFSNDVC
ncbi:unnamed protein product [Vicia faba]|uniref:Uncharacterized protein n=1 Tax=Vicia faba TaxID=3906 RepID=A0AAV1AKT5_VICFA|nr:unnamed protein product [Vicia faba]